MGISANLFHYHRSFLKVVLEAGLHLGQVFRGRQYTSGGLGEHIQKKTFLTVPE